MRVTSAGTMATSTALLCALSLLACKKDKGGAEPPTAAENRDKAAQLGAPPLFAHIPADTPGVFASFDPIPAAYWDRLSRDLGPDLMKGMDQLIASMTPTSPPERFAHALLRELRANWSQDGVKKVLGLKRDARFAFYGLGVVPVFRLELADEKALVATVNRLAAESQLVLPTATAGGRSYWRFADDDVLMVVAVADNQLIVAGGPTLMVEQGLPFILGVEKPTPNMADGSQLKKLAADHGFSGYGLGYLDSNNLLKLLAMAQFFGGATGAATMPPACKDELAALARRFPRLAFGYDEISDKRFSARMILETDAALAGRLGDLVTDVPGFVDGKLADRPLLAFGVGLDIEKARALALDFADGIGRFGTACGKEEMVTDAANMRGKLSQPIPPELAAVRGGLMTVLSGEMDPDGKPQNVSAFALLASADPKALLALAQKQMPNGDAIKVAPDGAFHEVFPAGSIPGLGDIQAAVKPAALVAAVGPEAAPAAERALAQTGKAPLFYIGYDYGKIMKTMMSALVGQTPGAAENLALKMASIFGFAATWAYPSDKGLAFAISMELN